MPWHMQPRQTWWQNIASHDAGIGNYRVSNAAGSALPRQKMDCVFFAGLRYVFGRKTTGLPVLPVKDQTLILE